MKGIAIKLYERTPIGTGSLGSTEYREEDFDIIENALVSPLTPEEAISEYNLTGRRLAYNIGIPKGDAHEWENHLVEFFGTKFRIVGGVQYGIEKLVPGQWHGIARCEVYE